MAQWRDYHTYCRQHPHVGGRPHTVVGTLMALPGVWSPELENERDILVHLPPSYERGDRRYPVVYMQDGQNLFDEATSFSGEWRVDETMMRLGADGIEAIIVGVPNMGAKRLDEYSPFHQPGLGGGQGEAYVAFLADTLKPLIDADFRTWPEPSHTAVLGSSMGGLISFFAYFNRPDVFRLAGVMSPSLWFAGGAMFDYVAAQPYAPGKIYLDAGTRELAGSPHDKRRRARSRRYYASVRRMQRLLYRSGYRPRREMLYVEEKWAGHREAAWARRLPDSLRFLLPAQVFEKPLAA